MQIIVLGQDKGKNYIDLVEFCSVRGIKLVEEKITPVNIDGDLQAEMVVAIKDAGLRDGIHIRDCDREKYDTCLFDTCTVCSSWQRATCRAIRDERIKKVEKN